jgi:hypothetical protein
MSHITLGIENSKLVLNQTRILMSVCQHYTLQQRTGTAGYVIGPEVTIHRREHVLYHDLPDLRPIVFHPATSDAALVDVAQGIHDTVPKARADRNDRADTREES